MTISCHWCHNNVGIYVGLTSLSKDNVAAQVGPVLFLGTWNRNSPSWRPGPVNFYCYMYISLYNHVTLSSHAYFSLMSTSALIVVVLCPLMLLFYLPHVNVTLMLP